MDIGTFLFCIVICFMAFVNHGALVDVEKKLDRILEKHDDELKKMASDLKVHTTRLSDAEKADQQTLSETKLAGDAPRSETENKPNA